MDCSLLGVVLTRVDSQDISLRIHLCSPLGHPAASAPVGPKGRRSRSCVLAQEISKLGHVPGTWDLDPPVVTPKSGYRKVHDVVPSFLQGVMSCRLLRQVRQGPKPPTNSLPRRVLVYLWFVSSNRPSQGWEGAGMISSPAQTSTLREFSPDRSLWRR